MTITLNCDGCKRMPRVFVGVQIHGLKSIHIILNILKKEWVEMWVEL